jgi:glycosyltransferase involved in cell wall biosynthesis
MSACRESTDIHMTNHKIKVCFFSPSAAPLFYKDIDHVFGGAEVQLFLLAKELVKDTRFSVFFLVGDFRQKDQTIHGVNVRKTYQLKLNFLSLLAQPLKIWMDLLKIRPDIVIQRSAGVDTAFIAAFCRLLKKRFIFSIAHSRDIDGTFVEDRGLKGLLYSLGFKMANFVVAQNSEQLQMMKHRFMRKNCKLIPPGYPVSRRSHKTPGRYILWVARGEAWKHPESFLRLALDFPRESFFMLMPKSPKACGLWQRIEKQTRKISNLHFEERIPFHKIDNLFDKSYLLVNTSSKEGFPNTFIQAARMGVPILSLKVDPDDFIRKNRLGVTCDGHYPRLKRGLHLLISNDNLYNEFKNNCCKYFVQKHDITQIAQSWKEILLAL